MPLFFREEKKVSLKNASAKAVDLAPEGVPTNNDLENNLSSNSAPDEQTRNSDFLLEVPVVLPEVVPSRKTKHINWLLTCSTTLLLAPIIVLLLLMATDSFTRDFAVARLHWVMKDNNKAIQFFSKALEKKQDTKTLEARAECYDLTGDLKNERADLRQLVQSTDLKTMPKTWHTYRRYSNLANLEARLGDMDSAKKLYTLYSTFPVGGTDRQSHYKQEAAYQLLLLDDKSKSKAIMAEMANSEPDLLSNTMGLSNASVQVLRALHYREDGEKAQALDKIRSLGDKYAWAFRDSRLRYKDKDEVVFWSLEALLHLDDRDAGKARPLIQQAEKELNGDDKSKPILDVLKAWMLLEEGKLDDCLNLTKATLASQRELERTIVGLNLKAALHLIRKNVFELQKQTNQAEHEDQLYKQTRVSGRIFTPLCFRTDR